MRIVLLASLCVFATAARAGGPTCAPGYCLDFDGNGCHPCYAGATQARQANSTPIPTTPTGIPIDTEWKQRLYAFAQKNVVHPSWGLAHSERDYQVTKAIAEKEGFSIDGDALFAAAFLHDLGGIGTFAKKGVDHAARSVEVIEPLLPTWGFPPEKWPQVKDLILGHVYYGPKPESKAAQAFRDADILDFLGVLGAARILAVTEEPGFASGTLAPSVATLRDFARKMAAKCSLRYSQELAAPRQAELEKFLSNLDAETFGGKAL